MGLGGWLHNLITLPKKLNYVLKMTEFYGMEIVPQFLKKVKKKKTMTFPSVRDSRTRSHFWKSLSAAQSLLPTRWQDN